MTAVLEAQTHEAPRPTVHRRWVDELPVIVVDGLLSPLEVRAAEEFLQTLPFARTESARPDTRAHRHWVARFTAPQPALIDHLVARTLDGMALAEARPAHAPYRVYCNANQFGDVLFPHQDSVEPSRTALWYLNSHWDLSLSGETIFIDRDEEIACSITPRPGRLVIFDGRILHAGRAPSKSVTGCRYTLAVKFR